MPSGEHPARISEPGSPNQPGARSVFENGKLGLTPHFTPHILELTSLLRFGCFARAGKIKCQNAPFSQTTANGQRHMDSVYVCPRKTAAPCWRAAAPRAATNSPLATREPYGTPGNAGYPKTARILRAADFRRAYNQGTRFTGRYFAAFCLRVPAEDPGASNARGTGAQGPRLGFTLPRAFGKAVLRNRVKRRLREALRVRLPEMAAEWDIVINPRRPAIAAPIEELRRELDRLVAQCKKL
jgi:ribonuclease P protein component